MVTTSVPVVGRSSSHLFPQVIRITLPDGLFSVACCIQDSSRAHERVADFVEFVEQIAHLELKSLCSQLRDRCEIEQGLVSFSFARSSGAEVVVGAMGDGSVSLQRKGQRRRIVQGPEFRLLQGKIHAGDLVFVETGALSRISGTVPQNVSEAVVVAEELGVVLANPESELGVAGVIVQVEKGTEKQKPHPIEPKVPTETESVSQHDQPEWMNEVGTTEQSTSRKKASWKMLVAILLVLLTLVLGGSIALGLRKEEARKKEASLTASLQPVVELFALAQSKEQIDVVKAREYVQQAVEQIQPILSAQKPGSVEEQRVKKTLQELQQFAERISEEKKFATIEPFFDLRLIQPDFRAGALALAGDTAYILNAKNGKVYSLDVKTKRASAIESEDSAPVGLIVPVGKSMYTVGKSIQRSGKTIFQADSSWSKPIIAGWYSGNFYVADSGSNMVRKFLNADSKTTQLQGGESWLKPEATANLESWASMAIDGRIWIGTTDGKVLRYLQGKNDPFALKGIEPAFSGPLALSFADTDFLYILDSEGARLVVIKKNGEFVQAYKVPVIAGANGFAMTADGKTAYVAVDTLVYKLPLE